MEKIKDIFRDNLKTLRDLRKWTQQQAAELSDIPFPTYRSIENGINFPRQEQITALAKGFNVEEWVLFSAAIEKAGYLSKMPRELMEAIEDAYNRQDEAKIKYLENAVRGYSDPFIAAVQQKSSGLTDGEKQAILSVIDQFVKVHSEVVRPDVLAKRKPRLG